MNIKRIATIVSSILTDRIVRTHSLLRERDHWRNQYRRSEYNLIQHRRELAAKFLEKNREIESLKTQLKTIRQIFDEYGNNSEMLNRKLFELFMGTSVENLNTTLKATAKLLTLEGTTTETVSNSLQATAKLFEESKNKHPRSSGKCQDGICIVSNDGRLSVVMERGIALVLVDSEGHESAKLISQLLSTKEWLVHVVDADYLDNTKSMQFLGDELPKICVIKGLPQTWLARNWFKEMLTSETVVHNGKEVPSPYLIFCVKEEPPLEIVSSQRYRVVTLTVSSDDYINPRGPEFLR